jgi:23S rRNA (cytidine1920-2'-O)/16S rRNA (cytidine1409-2'-O)-methyltransferase
LQHGATQVVGIDVGHGQLHPRLATDPRVTCIEGVNARDLSDVLPADVLPAAGFDLVVADLSFISLTLVLPTVRTQLTPTGDALLLVKPQFELQPGDIGKGGLVKHAAALARVEARLRAACAGAGLSVLGYFASAIDGGDGNREFFLWARNARDTAKPAASDPSSASTP